LEAVMAKKARKKSAVKARKTKRAKVKTKTKIKTKAKPKTLAKKKPAQKARQKTQPKGIAAAVVGASPTVVDTVKETEAPTLVGSPRKDDKGTFPPDVEVKRAM
jgi:hypothetical protein